MHRKWPDVQKYLVYFSKFYQHPWKGWSYSRALWTGYQRARCSRESILERAQTVYQTKPSNIWLNYRAHAMWRLNWACRPLMKQPLTWLTVPSYELYVETVKRLRKYPKIEIVSHLINGLPGETHEMMIENVRRCVTDNDIQGIKLHLLHPDD